MAGPTWTEAMGAGLSQASNILGGQSGGGLGQVKEMVDKYRAQREVKEGATKAGGGDAAPDVEGYKKAYRKEDIQGSKKKGGRIPKTGVYKLHKGEVVIPERIAKRMGKSRKSGRR